MTILAELARRAASHPHATSFVKRAVEVHNGKGAEIEIPTWGVAVIYVSIFAASIFMSLVSYMLHEVVTTLCMVESPMAAVTVSPSTQEPSDKEEEKETLLETGPTITIARQKPITSSIRGTLRHLIANGGRFARFRGFRIHCLYSLLSAVVVTFFGGALAMVPGQSIIAAGLSGAVLANVHAAWTHKVVGMPSEKTFWQRIPAKSHWKTLALPATVEAVMPYISIYMTIGVAVLLGLLEQPQKTMTCAQWTGLVARSVALVIFSITCTLFLCLPAMVTLIRIEASILPEDEDTIVPFDRTFGGKVVSKLMGGTGVVGFLDAWRSFDWEARRRLIKTFVKSFAIMMAIVLVVVHVLIFEIYVVMGPAIGKYLAQMRQAEDFPKVNGA
jgi:hypothetical protein